VPVPTDPKAWVRIHAATQLVAALGLATGKAPRLSSAVLAGSLVPTTLAGHRFWEESDPTAKKMQRIQFLKNLSLLGGLLIAAGDTNGKPGVAWRARHAAQDARRTARQEARLLKAKAHLR
jgi:putative oxidoreductase